MTKSPQTRAELIHHRQEQLDFIVSACNQYDAGKHHFIKQAATAIRVLVHNFGSSHALLAQLDLLDRMTLVDSVGPIDESNLVTTNNLVSLTVGAPLNEGMRCGGYTPILDGFHASNRAVRTAFGTSLEAGPGRCIPFDDWWNQAVLKGKNGTRRSRKDLVLDVCNQDGGAHVDPGVKESHWHVSRGNALGWLSLPEGATVEDGEPLGNPVPASVRQIAHEFVISVPEGWLSDRYPEFILPSVRVDRTQ